MTKKLATIALHCDEDLKQFISMQVNRGHPSASEYLHALVVADMERMKHEYSLLHAIFGGEGSTSSSSSLNEGEEI